MNKNIFEIVEEVLKTNLKYVSDDGKLLKAMVYSDVMTMDKELLCLLLSNEKIKERFFKDVNGTLIFDKQKFTWFIDSKEFLPDSYTKYMNKIGLTHNGNFISKSNDVVLDFPYKDCILEGGQNKDDEKRKEIFYNEVIANDEINRMLSPKVFTNAKKYTKDGVEENITFDNNDNLIIKGNNLIALASILKRYEGEVKCIYIDPPYNTGSDSFNYNDSFNHSTWLTFMKNRLELARKLLNDRGLIFVQCDDNEQAYLKVLMDEIFGKDMFVGTVVYRKRKSQANLSKDLSTIHEYILIYKKSNLANLKKISTSINTKEYSNPDGDYRGLYKTMPCTNKGGALYTIKTPTGKEIKDEWRFKEERFYELLNDNRIVFPKNGEGKPRYKLFLEEKQIEGVIVNSWWDDLGTNQDANRDLTKLFESNVFSYPKSEDLLRRIIEIATDKNDLILDYHLGSGTTCSVAHKMCRRYIGIEQMDYIETVPVERLKKVIEGEQTGISKMVAWNGGGSFVYCELLEDAATLIDRIRLGDDESINNIKSLIYSDDRIISYILKEELLAIDNNFNSLNLEEKKKVLIKLINKNKLYVNYSDIEDEEMFVKAKDKNFTKSFYEDF
ncbi:DNA methyltransferase [Fusobacterium hwasookii]|uniref:Cytosine methyltransferase n=2 Tax=Fusobacterium hwasookii TaxID=1583098 RepID=A0AAC8WL86_9FUSO|nr:site-specific DNA-methyltransferase [Fusobacterium hwasookii]ALQ35702.1 cytosine methyltransferase [Fusobacterium hwasookii ChDC F206]EJU08624.1 DNA (cytosine-5-)-methyltransferase [Fusobacterium hwasookii ChDC F128]